LEDPIEDGNLQKGRQKTESGACKEAGVRLVFPLILVQPQQRAHCAASTDLLFMSVKIRMKRVGTKNTPVFRIVVADSRSPRDGKFIEELGTYQPLKKGNNYTLDLDRAKYWLSKGAQPSETVASFIKKANKTATAAAAA
jgi:small subunit ribosomal protein S16